MVAINSKMPALQMKDLKNRNKQDIETLATGLKIYLRFEYEEDGQGMEGSGKRTFTSPVGARLD